MSSRRSPWKTAPVIPLFVALDHEGDGYPYTRVTGGMTPLPNSMAIGATWDPDNARIIGEITGRELAALGFNFLLGPDVDVLYNPHPTGRGDIGTRTFGGDPWWVAQMGRAYICGVHTGGDGHVATVAKHFPGHGGSDRLPDREIATVDKSLTELKRIELPPFFAATEAQSEDDCAVTDAMMTSHIRYRGLQGNIRQFTAPISFDAEGLGSILGLPEFAAWRSEGLIVSDALGVPAVAKYFDPSEQTFPHRQIAKEALMAGNDLLSIDQFARPQGAALQSINLADTVTYFQEEYRDNPQFRQRVEDAVARILRVKMKLYGGQFTQQAAMVNPDEALKVTGQGTAAVSDIAREAVTLLYTQGNTLPAPPRRDEDILIFTDAERVKDCQDPSCEWYEALPVTAVQDTIVRLYGPDGTGQVDPARIHSVSFSDLKAHMANLLEGSQVVTPTVEPAPAPTPPPDIAGLLESARWIIFAMRNSDRDENSDAVRIFLDNGAGKLGDKKLVVLAFNAPYYLDTTEVNKLALYLAAYSKTQPFIEAAIRALFGELTPVGHPPVSVEGINYDLLKELSPDPARSIPLAQLEPASGSSIQAPADVRIQAGPLVDHNGNLVPDGTEVTIEAGYPSNPQYLPVVTGMTTNGMVTADFTLREAGSVFFSVRSGDAIQDRGLRIVLDPPPTVSPLPSNTPAPAATASPTAKPEATATSQPTEIPGQSRQGGAAGGLADGARAGILLLALAGTGLAGLAGFLWLRTRHAPAERRLRWMLLCLSGGMAGYILYLVALPAAWQLPPVASGAAFIGALAGMPLVGREHATRDPSA